MPTRFRCRYGCRNLTTKEFMEVEPLGWSAAPGAAVPEFPLDTDCVLPHAKWDWKIPKGELYLRATHRTAELRPSWPMPPPRWTRQSWNPWSIGLIG